MTIPPYIPGVVATALAVGAALSPSEADSMSHSGFLRWILVTVCAGGGVVLWRFADVMWHFAKILERIEAKLGQRDDARDALLLEAAKEAMKP